MLRIGKAGFKSHVFSLEFWRQAWDQSWAFAPQCLWCAAAMLLSNLIAVGSTAYLDESLRHIAEKPISDLSVFVAPCLAALACIAVALPLSLWALWHWLLKLTAFADWVISENAQPAAIQTAVARTLARKPYLVQVWLVASLLLLLPALLLAVLIAARTVFNPSASLFAVNPKLLGLPGWAHSQSIQAVLWALGIVLSVLTLAYSLVTLAFSSISELPPSRTALLAAAECLKNSKSVITAGAVVLAFNVLLSAPQLVLTFVPANSTAARAVLEAATQTWLSLTSIVAWPLSVAPFSRFFCRSTGDELG